MTYDLRIEKKNNVFIKIHSGQDIARELSELFTFDMPNARFHPAVKAKLWDGRLRLFNYKTREVYAGLLKNILEYCEQSGYLVDNQTDPHYEISDEDLQRFIDKLEPSRTPYDYQFAAFAMAIRERKRLLISPTASGKSFMMYLVTRYINEVFKKRVLIVVPSTQLVAQLASDFLEYNNGEPLDIYQIRDGAVKNNTHGITISTWQAIADQPSSWYKPFGGLLGDEVHTFKADSLRRIGERCNTMYRLGFTGTLDGSETNELVLQGLFGVKHQVTTYAELRRRGIIADPRINVLLLTHNDETRKASVKTSYDEEINIIAESNSREDLLIKLIGSLDGNTLILFQKIGKHLKPMHERMIEEFGKDNTHMIYGGVKTDDREIIRDIFDKSSNAKLSASYQTFQQGINVVNINHIVFASPTKSNIRLLQSIGRGLRRSETKTTVNIWDIADDLRWKKSWTNHTYSHLQERINIYNREEFNYKLFTRNLR